VDKLSLLEAVKDFDDNSFAILYAPRNCYLARLKGGKFCDQSGEIDVSEVYEARVFNEKKELRWVKGYEPKIISDDDFPNSESIEQTYLLWGKSTGETQGDWTKFAEARIGAFYVPIKIDGVGKYAHFKALEYLAEFEDGNMAVVEERLTGITEVK
jgi:CRISPR-associated protein (TIGR03984 family)